MTLASAFAVSGQAVAGAQELPDNCDAVDDVVTCVYGFTGDTQEFTVPDGVTSLDVTAVGAEGGGGACFITPGRAASVSGTISAEPGESLFLVVGGQGGAAVNGASAAGGFNGGGSGGGPMGDALGGGGGGGATDVRTDLNDLNTRVLVAAGGGGVTYLGDGGNAGQAGEGQTAGGGGGAGKSDSGGTGGSYISPDADGEDGTLGQGGDGGDSVQADRGSGGGGGGGLYGGGGGVGHDSGKEAGAGGGGSSLGDTVQLADAGEPASVTIVYVLPPEPCDWVCDLTGSIDNLFGS